MGRGPRNRRSPFHVAVDRVKRELLLEALESSDSIREAARKVGLVRATFYQQCAYVGIPARQYKRGAIRQVLALHDAPVPAMIRAPIVAWAVARAGDRVWAECVLTDRDLRRWIQDRRLVLLSTSELRARSLVVALRQSPRPSSLDVRQSKFVPSRPDRAGEGTTPLSLRTLSDNVLRSRLEIA